MATGQRFKSGGTRGIAEFLAAHQHCDAGFDVRRQDEPGSGKLEITCLGCGQSVAYRAAEAGQLAAAGLEIPPVNGHAPPEPLASDSGEPAPAATAGGPTRSPARPPGAPPVSPRPGSPGPAQRSELGGGLPRWVPTALIALLIAGGLALVAIGLLTTDDDESGSGAPAGPEVPAAEQPQDPAPAEEPPARAPQPDAGEELTRRTFDGYSIGLPAGWRAAPDGEGRAFEAPGAAAAVSVFSGQSGAPPLEFAELSDAFLSDRHDGARVGAPRAIRFGGRPAAEVRVSYPGGRERAVFVAAGGLTYVLIERTERGAPAQQRREARAVLDSFAPR